MRDDDSPENVEMWAAICTFQEHEAHMKLFDAVDAFNRMPPRADVEEFLSSEEIDLYIQKYRELHGK